MFDSDSSECELERVNSVSSTPESFDVVPSKLDFRIRVFGEGCSKKGTSFLYTLQEGKALPYSTRTVTKKGKGIIIQVFFMMINLMFQSSVSYFQSF